VSSHSARVPSVSPEDVATRSFGILSSFPPTPCGIATFSAALATGLIENGATVDVVRCGVSPPMEDALVVASLEQGPLGGVGAAIDALNRSSVAVIQHEYGLYKGVDGAAVLEIVDGVVVPSIVVAHTVVLDPSPTQRAVLEQLCDAADVVVVMTATAQVRLLERYDVDASKIHLVPHGATTPALEANPHEQRRLDDTPHLLTWGLLGPGKGIEWAIDAVASLSDLQPRPSYVVAGATHPKVAAETGESYREMLIRRAWSSGASPFVTFDGEYRDFASLTQLIHTADLVILPYDSEDQVTSGVLVDAVAAGRPVVSTAFPHAVELLGSGAGIVVPQRDPEALAAAIRSVITDRELASAMAAEARRLAPDLAWGAVARQYDGLADMLLAERESVRS
jgi:glycosyltransferase involved in cell wall biosynthesis